MIKILERLPAASVIMASPDNNSNAASPAAVAIDFGTDGVRVGVWKDGELHVVKTIPASIAFTNTSTRVGDEALRHAAHDPGRLPSAEMTQTDATA